MTLQQFAEATMLKEKRSKESKDQAQRDAKLPGWRSLTKSLSRSFRKAGSSNSREGPAVYSDDMVATDGSGAAPTPPTALEITPQGLLQEVSDGQAQSPDKAEEEREGRDAGTSYEDVKGSRIGCGEIEHSQQPTVSVKEDTHLFGRHSLAAVKPGPGQLHDVTHMLWHKTLPRCSQSHAETEPVAEDEGRHRQRRQVPLPLTEVEICLAEEAAEGTVKHT